MCPLNVDISLSRYFLKLFTLNRGHKARKPTYIALMSVLSEEEKRAAFRN